MKKVNKVIWGLLSLVCIVNADTVYLNSWSTGSGGNIRANIDFTNICDEKTVNVDVKFWKANGTILANTAINADLSTNEQGIISLSIEPKVTKSLFMHDSYIKESGHGEISTYSTGTPSIEYPKCIIGKVRMYSTKTGNPYDGLGINYLINNGKRF